jgi:DNA-binding HxlR family transcriptional regulator
MNEICPKFEKAISILEKRWMGLIVLTLLEGPKRFNELEKAIPISAKVLSERLKQLEKEEIVIRNIYPETPVRIEYTLSEKGIALETVIHNLESWATKWVK